MFAPIWLSEDTISVQMDGKVDEEEARRLKRTALKELNVDHVGQGRCRGQDMRETAHVSVCHGQRLRRRWIHR